MRLIRTITATGTALGGAGYLLIRFAPAPAELAQQLQAPRSWIAQVGTDAAVATVAGALLWLCALWVVIGLAAAWIGQLPGVAGQLGRTVTRCAVPIAIQRLVAASAGFSLLLGGASASAVGQPARDPSIPASAMTAPGWPLDQPAQSALPTGSALPARSAQPAGSTQPARSALPSGQPVRKPASRSTPSQPVESPTPNRSATGGWPLDPSSGLGSPDPAPTGAPAASTVPGPGRTAAVAKSAAPTHPSDAPSTVTVQPGDSLWTIASAELGPAATDRQIAIAWPYWYRANRPLIGRDPDLLRPGSRLNRPEAGPAAERPDGRPSNQSQPIREGLRP